MTKRGLFVVLVGFGLAGWALAQEPVPCENCPQQAAPGQMGNMPAFQEPMLTDQQQEKMDQLRLNHLKEVMPLETDLEIKGMELEALWRADSPDGKKIVAKVKEIAAVRTQLEVSRVSQRLATWNVLTPEQRAQARKFMGRPMPGMGRGRMGMGRNQMRGMGRRMGRMGRGRMNMMGPGPMQGQGAGPGMPPDGCPGCPQMPD